ncbi:DNA primase [Aureispira anguillae]|uniref:DNA primase n=1 Tax=Aureispira anguillae TaxID=2864201 RepID=A0A915YHM7_9BACT|nr:DNA primase [Aureispira anguillae]BDS13098.1 DNA primase [Aureispira anguillae]
MYITNIEQLKSKFEIETIVSSLTDWKEGSKAKLCCPFHQEKTPSFSISKSKNIATCFGSCGKTYTPISFVMEYKQVDFLEAVEYAAKVHHLAVEYAENVSEEQLEQLKKRQQKKEQYLLYNRLLAAAYYNHHHGAEELKENIQFDKRSLQGSTVKTFGICQTPEAWHFTQSLKLEHSILEQLGIVKQGKKGLFDAYRNRVLFPIHNQSKAIVGFAGRALDDSQPKYLNSPESEVYHKEQLLYGLAQQLSAIKKTKTMYLVEGYWDVLSLYDGGFLGAVAAGGTSLSKQQAKLINRYAERVVLLYDGDKAGIEAAIRNLPALIELGLHVDTIPLPEKQDPDSYIRKIGKEAFVDYCNTNKTDAINWYLEHELQNSDRDNFAIQRISELAIELIAKIKNELVRDCYIRDVSKLLDIKQSVLSIQLRDKMGALSFESEQKSLSSRQRADLFKYGMYEDGNQYWCSNAKGGYTCVSNFVVKPLFHLKSKDNPKRLFELLNKYNQKVVLDVEAAVLVGLDKFRLAVEAEGNYFFTGNLAQYNRIKGKIYDEMKTCYEIDVLGYHKDNFYTFGNGIYTIDKGFVPVNSYGILSYQDKRYFLPAFSDIYKDSDKSFKDEKNFAYQDSKITFKDWSTLFCKVHGSKGQIATCFYVAALFRDVIHDYVNFPLLNLFGQPGTGKSFMGKNLSYMFGIAKDGFNLNSGTLVGFYNRLVLARNSLVFCEEYFNSIDFRFIQGLKSIYDGIGREKGQKTGTKSLVSEIYSACMFVGQELPTSDNALFTRVINLAFSQTEYTQEESDLAEELKAMRKNGELINITAKLSTFRPYIEDNYEEQYNLTFSKIKKAVAAKGIHTRLIENNAAILTVFDLLKEKVSFPFSTEEVYQTCIQNILRQNDQIHSETETATFWDIIEYLVSAGLLIEGIDYKIESRMDLKGKKFDQPKPLLYLSFSKAFPLYREHHKRQYSKDGLTKSSLSHYLKTNGSFMDYLKSTRIGKKNTSAFVFDYDALNINIQDEPQASTDYVAENEIWAEQEAHTNKIAEKRKKEEAETAKKQMKLYNKIIAGKKGKKSSK